MPPDALPGSPGPEDEGAPGRPGGLDKVGRSDPPGDEEDDGGRGIPPGLDCAGIGGGPP